MEVRKLVELASTIRSKNAGVNNITFDIIFSNPENYRLVKKSGVLNKSTVAKLFDISEDRIVSFVEFDPANAIKFTIRRGKPSGSPGESDVFGSQQYAPLLDIKVPI
jgi:hypothetical protein